MPHASFDGLRVLSLESRRAKEVAKLIATYSGVPTVVPVMREVPLSSNTAALDFARDLIAGQFDLVVFFTGVGVKALVEIVATEYPREDFLAALRKVQVAVRGPKPRAALRELNVPIHVVAPEPSTWRELLAAITAEYGPRLATLRVAVQEYGASNPEFLAQLSERSGQLTRVPVYQWALPEDLEPLRQCIRSILAGQFDVALFMTAIQVIHLFQVAEQMAAEGITPAQLRAALNAMVLVSIGPTTTEEMEQYGIKPDFEPSQSKMGFLVNEAAQYANKILQQKRTATPAPAATAAPEPEPSTAAAPSAQAASSPVPKVAASTSTMAGFRDALAPIDFLHEISSSLAAEPDSLHLVLERIVAFVTSVIPCDSCFLYVLEGQKDGQKLVLRASKNPHADVVDQLGVLMGQGITGWVAEHREPVALASNASNDPRFKAFKNLPEDHFEAMLSVPILCASKVVGVLNLQHRLQYRHTEHEVRLLSMLGFLVGAEIERARLETENQLLANRLETRKLLDRAKGILQRDLGVHEDEAYRRMQSESRQRRKSMREIAEAILLADDLRKSTQPPK